MSSGGATAISAAAEARRSGTPVAAAAAAPAVPLPVGRCRATASWLAARGRGAGRGRGTPALAAAQRTRNGEAREEKLRGSVSAEPVGFSIDGEPVYTVRRGQTALRLLPRREHRPGEAYRRRSSRCAYRARPGESSESVRPDQCRRPPGAVRRLHGSWVRTILRPASSGELQRKFSSAANPGATRTACVSADCCEPRHAGLSAPPRLRRFRRLLNLVDEVRRQRFVRTCHPRGHRGGAGVAEFPFPHRKDRAACRAEAAKPRR